MVLIPQNKVHDILELAGIVWSRNFVLPKNHSFSFETFLEGSTLANIDVFLEQSNSQLTDAEQGLVHADYVVPEDQGVIATLDDFDTTIMVGSPVVTLFGRLKFVKATGNNAANKLTRIKMGTSENG